jgi:hypothetical protein
MSHLLPVSTLPLDGMGVADGITDLPVGHTTAALLRGCAESPLYGIGSHVNMELAGHGEEPPMDPGTGGGRGCEFLAEPCGNGHLVRSRLKVTTVFLVASSM